MGLSRRWLGFLDAFCKAAADVDPAAADLDESRRFPDLRALCDTACPPVEVTRIGAKIRFAGYGKLWRPFTTGAGPAPGYKEKLPCHQLGEVRAAIFARLGRAGGLSLPERAWAIRRVPN